MKISGPRVARVVFAPDSFKGSIRASAAAAAMAEGWSRARPHDELVCLPMSDGGEGTLECFEAVVPGAKRMELTVDGPLGSPVETSWLRLPSRDHAHSVGVVELATTSGIEHVPSQEMLRPLDASTFGFGQAIRAALADGVEELVLTIGGSASSDGGAGLLQALGASVLNAAGDSVPRGARGLASAAALDLRGIASLPSAGATVLADVSSPLLGPLGAAEVFSPQKGATTQQVVEIERALARWASLVPIDPTTPGAGAAGGAGFGLLVWGARIVPGAAEVARLVGLRGEVESSDFVVTGEGSFDGQSAQGKAPSLVLEEARRVGLGACVIGGRVTATPAYGTAVSLTDLAGSPGEAMANAEHWLRHAGQVAALRYSAGS